MIKLVNRVNQHKLSKNQIHQDLTTFSFHGKCVRRNRRHLQAEPHDKEKTFGKLPEKPEQSLNKEPNNGVQPHITRSRRTVKPKQTFSM